MHPKLSEIALIWAILTSQPALSQWVDKVDKSPDLSNTNNSLNIQEEVKSRFKLLLLECDMNNDWKIDTRMESQIISSETVGIPQNEYKCKLNFESILQDAENERLDEALEALVEELEHVNKKMSEGNGNMKILKLKKSKILQKIRDKTFR